MMRKQHPVSQVGLAIRAAVKQNPGIHFRGLSRAARVTSAGQLRHHLDRLERQGLLVEIEDGRYKRFFVAGDQDPKLRAEMARFSRAVPRRIARLLLVNPMNRTELRRSLGCADSTLGYHLTRMVLLGDLARTRGPSSCLYSLTNEETVRKMLLMQGALAEPAHETDPGLAPPGDGLLERLQHGDAPDRSPGDIPNPLRPEPAPVSELPFPQHAAPPTSSPSPPSSPPPSSPPSPSPPSPQSLPRHSTPPSLAAYQAAEAKTVEAAPDAQLDTDPAAAKADTTTALQPGADFLDGPDAPADLTGMAGPSDPTP